MPARILVIEDHPTNLQLMDYLLRAYGHHVSSASTGTAGVEAARRDLPELIVCDIQLPELDGFGVIDQLRADRSTRDIPVVAVTAYAMAGDEKRMLAAGFDGYLAKPIDPQTFVTDIESYLPSGARGPVRAPAQATNHTSTRTATLDGRRVLAVDDSKANLGLLRTVLEPNGFDVTPARSPRQALRLLREDPPDLVISDVHMDGGGGFELIRQMKADPALRDIPVVFLSTTVWDDADRATARDLGAEAFIMRPVEPQVLIETIESIIERDH